MINNQEMANILCNSNLATADQINGSWSEITATYDIGMVLVDKGLLLPKVYEDLLAYIDSLHPENAVIQPDSSSVGLPDNEEPIIPITVGSSEISIDEQLNGAKSFDEQLAERAEALHSVNDNNFIPHSEDSISVNSGHGDEDYVTERITDSFPNEALVLDLDDVELHVEKDVQLDKEEYPLLGDNVAGNKTESLMQPEPNNGDRVIDAVQENIGKRPPVEIYTGELKQKTVPQVFQNDEDSMAILDEPLLDQQNSERHRMEALNLTIPESISAESSLDEILLFARSTDVSDVHLIPNSPVTMRRFGLLESVSEKALSADMIEQKLLSSLPESEMKIFHTSGDAEFVYTIPGDEGRFRITIMKVRNGWTLSARVIPAVIRSFDSIGLSDSAYSLTRWAQGLVLVTGPTGCGKSTTLSTLIETINSERKEHIITIEDPIETLFPLGQSQITQRQVGLHTMSQDNALRGALRQDPDILMVSELRDMESIQLAVSAAETGHLVFGTMNTTNAIRTINRLIESFPADEQGVMRNMISESLRGVICQQLIPRKDGTGLVPAFEILLVTSAVANMIRKNEMHQLGSAMLTGRSQGMVLFDDSLMTLLKDDIISAEEAYFRAGDKDTFKPFLSETKEN